MRKAPQVIIDAMARFVMIGGFLGAGKTTAILRLARLYAAAGRRVAIIANDRSEGMVDGATYRAHGLPVEEIAGACFACTFDELVAAAGRLVDGHQPNVLLAEPSGSCTDLVARVIEPLKRLYAGRFEVAPYVALLDPHRAMEALGGRGPACLSAKVTYLYRMQQHEADIAAINKADLLTPQEREQVTALVERNFPKADVMAVSARTGEGFDRLAEALDGGRHAGTHPLAPDSVDYAQVAEADDALSWLSVAVRLTAPQAFDADALLLDLARGVQAALGAAGAEPAHVKMMLRSDGLLAIANVVGSQRAPELSHRARQRTTAATLLLNARVETTEGALREGIEAAIRGVAGRYQLDAATSPTSARRRSERLR